MLALNQLAFQVIKLDTDDAIALSLKPRAGIPCLQINYNQQFEDDMYICWFYEPPVGIKTYLYATVALVLVFGVVLFPLWPLAMRLAVWYLSVGLLGLVAAFFGIALVRLVLFVITYVAIKPGLWIFPNLFEDVGVIESFVPFWAWHGIETMERYRPKKRVSKKKKQAKLNKKRALDEQAQTRVEAQAELQMKIELINAKLKAITDQREKEGKPLAPAEMAELGQSLFAEVLGPPSQGPAKIEDDYSKPKIIELDVE